MKLSWFPVPFSYRLVPEEKCGICLEAMADQHGMPLDASALVIHSFHGIDTLFQWHAAWLKSIISARLMPSGCAIHRKCLELYRNHRPVARPACPICRQVVDMRHLAAYEEMCGKAAVKFMAGVVFLNSLLAIRQVLYAAAPGISEVAAPYLANRLPAGVRGDAMVRARGVENVAFNIATLALALIPACLIAPWGISKLCRETGKSFSVICREAMEGVSLLLLLDGFEGTRLLQDEFRGAAPSLPYFEVAVLVSSLVESVLAFKLGQTAPLPSIEQQVETYT